MPETYTFKLITYSEFSKFAYYTQDVPKDVSAVCKLGEWKRGKKKLEKTVLRNMPQVSRETQKYNKVIKTNVGGDG